MIMTGAQFKSLKKSDLEHIWRRGEGMSIRRYRKNNKIKAGEVTERLGISLSTLSRFERGVNFPQRSELVLRLRFAVISIVTDRRLRDEHVRA